MLVRFIIVIWSCSRAAYRFFFLFLEAGAFRCENIERIRLAEVGNLRCPTKTPENPCSVKYLSAIKQVNIVSSFR